MSSPENPLPISNPVETLPAPSEPQRRFPLWGLREVALVVAVAVIALMACSFVWLLAVTLVRHGRMLKPEDLASDPLIVLPPQVAAYGLTFAFIRRMLVHHFQSPFAEGMGWRWPRKWLAFPFAGALLAASVLLVMSQLPSPGDLPIEHFFRGPLDAWMMAGFGVLIAPVAEEILFRGLLFPALAVRVGTLLSVVLTALSFAVLHATQLGRAWSPLLMLFMVGVVLTVVRWRARSLAASVLTHMGYNAAMFVELFWATRGFHDLAGK